MSSSMISRWVQIRFQRFRDFNLNKNTNSTSKTLDLLLEIANNFYYLTHKIGLSVKLVVPENNQGSL